MPDSSPIFSRQTSPGTALATLLEEVRGLCQDRVQAEADGDLQSDGAELDADLAAHEEELDVLIMVTS